MVVRTIEERVETLERELGLLKGRAGGTESERHWISAITGSFADDPEFEEIVRLGRELRHADRPQDDD